MALWTSAIVGDDSLIVHERAIRQDRRVRARAVMPVGLIMVSALILVIAEPPHWFPARATLHTGFHNLGGLRIGSAVRMDGIDVGTVTGVHFPTDAHDDMLRVEFQIMSEAVRRVRRDSVAHIASRGVLGDKALDIDTGSRAQPGLADGDTIRGEDRDAIGEAIRNATSLLDRANSVIDNSAPATRRR